MLPLVTGGEWERTVLGAPRPVLVEFWRASCPICPRFERPLDALSAELGDMAALYRVDIDTEADLVWAYEVMATPTFIVICRGEPVARAYGDATPAGLRELVIDAIGRCGRD